jgi:hypothetical protein
MERQMKEMEDRILRSQQHSTSTQTNAKVDTQAREHAL